MTTAFKHAIAACGFSQREAAVFLGVSTASVASWCSDRRTPPDGVWKELGELYDLMDECAEQIIALIEEKKPDEIEFSYSGEHGRWPCVGIADAVEAMVRLRLRYAPKP